MAMSAARSWLDAEDKAADGWFWVLSEIAFTDIGIDPDPVHGTNSTSRFNFFAMPAWNGSEVTNGIDFDFARAKNNES